ncbi:MAG: flavin reductase [Kiritimatiellae bacterium]|nr:flavin reductase [Kiritimatiellia bacterium]
MDASAFFKIGYGLYLVTTRDGAGRDNGMICNTVVQATATPARITVIINKQNYTHETVKETGLMNVCVLSRSAPFSLFKRFGFQSGRDADKFEGMEKIRAANSLAIVGADVANAVFALKVASYVDLGTHGLFVCDVLEAQTMSGEPTMTYDYYHENVKPKPEAQKPASAGEPKKWVCVICGYVYDPAENGGVAFEDLPADWTCPWCKHPKTDFKPL